MSQPAPPPKDPPKPSRAIQPISRLEHLWSALRRFNRAAGTSASTYQWVLGLSSGLFVGTFLALFVDGAKTDDGASTLNYEIRPSRRGSSAVPAPNSR